MGMTERLPIVMTNTEPSNKHVIWLKDDMLKRWTGIGWKNIGGTGGSGTTNYNELINKPKINGVVLQGDVKLDLTSDIEIIDSLNSTAKDKALSANQGKILFDDLVAKDSEINNLRLAMSHKASLASTLEGYGIENAYNKLEINNMLKNITAENTSDVYKLQVFDYAADKFEELSTALNVGKIIILNDAFLGINYNVSNDTITIISLLLENTDTKANIEVGTFEFKKDGTYNLSSCNIPFTSEGEGTKFLSDDGTYKTITSGKTEVYNADVSQIGTVEFYNSLYDAYNKQQIITLNGLLATAIFDSNDSSITLLIQQNLPGDNGLASAVNIFKIQSDGTYSTDVFRIEFNTNGDGTKFLNDKGEYITVKSGESYDLATQTSNGLMSKEDKIKLDGLGDASGIILTQAQYDALETYDNVVYFIKG